MKRPSSSTILPSRITRSISFEAVALAHLKKRAKAEKRTVNWLVNDLARRDVESVRK